MTSVATIITDALQLLRIADANEALEAEDMATGIRTLNLMMRRWRADGLAPNWVDVGSPADTLPAAQEAEEAISYNLALRLQSRYGAQLDDLTTKAAVLSVARLWRDRLTSAGTGKIGDIVYRALRVISGGEVTSLPDNFSLQGALAALNALGSRWAKSGLIASWGNPSSIDASYSGETAQVDAFVYNLAIRLSSEYATPLRAELPALAQQGVSDLWRDRLTGAGAGTIGDVIYRALRVIRNGESTNLPDTFSLQGALAALNALGSRWAKSGLIASWTNVFSIDSGYNWETAQIDAFVYNLAIRLASEYGVPIRQEFPELAQHGVATLWRDRLTGAGTGTIGDVIYRALRVIRNGEITSLPDTFSLQGAIGALNALGSRWAKSGLIESWVNVSSIGDGYTRESAQTDAFVYSLAIRLSSEYAVPIREELPTLAQQGVNSLWRDRLTAAGTGTIGDIVYRALRVIRDGEVTSLPDTFSLQGAISALNALGSRWAKSGLIESWKNVSSIGSSYTGEDSQIDAFVYNLAIRLASEYAVPLREEFPALAQEGVAALWRDRLASTGSGTVGSVIRRALRLVRVPGGLPDTVNMTGAIDALNAMMRRWEVDGIAIGWSDVGALSQQLPTPPEAEEVIAYNLAIMLAPEYGADIRPDVVLAASSGLSMLSAQIHSNSFSRLSYDDLPYGQGQPGGSWRDGYNC